MSRILILRTDHLGDAILTTPLIRALAKAGHQVDFVLADAYLPLFEDNPFLHACHGLKAIAPDYPGKWLGLVKWLRRQRYDVLIIPRPLPRNLLAVSLFSGAKRRIMLTGPRAANLARLLLNECCVSTNDRPASDIILDTARHLSVATDGIQTDIFLREDEIARAAALLQERWGRSLAVGIHPGHNGNACQPASRIYEQICELILSQTNWRIVLTGVASEQRFLENWSPALLASDRVWNTMGLFPLRPAAALIKNLDLYICSATGTLHLASALGVPTLTAFCHVSVISQRVWGAQSGKGVALEPAPEQCSARDVHRGILCDFSGKISAEQFFLKAKEMLSFKIPSS